MLQTMVKLVITAGLIVAVSEIAKRTSTFGALLASLPLVSVLGMFWLYVDTGDQERVAALARDIFWLVLPSLPMFLLLPVLLRAGVHFYLSVGLGIALTMGLYAVTLYLLGALRPTE